MSQDRIGIRTFDAMRFYDPAVVLRHLRSLERDPRLQSLPEATRRLRTNSLKRWREGRIGALFAFGLGQQVLEAQVDVALAQEADFDFVTRWHRDGERHFCPVQEKEWPPADLNPAATLEGIMARLDKPSAPSRTVALLHLNRVAKVDLAVITPPAMGFAELWLIGSSDPDQNSWFIYGDALKSPRRFDFSYPS
ncbi:MAG: hypothetical protein AB1898_21250 [Acidobacteriota bacterium]